MHPQAWRRQIGLLFLLSFAFQLVGFLTLAQAQGPWGGRGGPRGGRRGFPRGGNPDDRMRFMADRIFSYFSGGKDVLVISEVRSSRDPNIQDKLNEFAQRQGITNGQLTREQFSSYIKERFSRRRSEDSSRPGSSPPASSSSGKSSAKSQSGDGEKSRSEDRSRSSRDSDRYRGYYPYSSEEPKQEEEKRPVVYHANNLPKELQSSWFSQLDTDEDGQVGLYEWKKAGRPTRDFRARDDNADGFVTAEEALRHTRVKEDPKTKSVGSRTASGARSTSPRFRGPRGSGRRSRFRRR